MKPSPVTAALIDALANESEATLDIALSKLPPDVKVERGHNRTRTLQVRMNDDEFADLEALALERGLPPSTVARSILVAALRPVGDFAAALDRIERDVQALRGRLVSA